MDKFMENRERALALFLILMIIVVVVATIIIMVLIWSPKEKKIEQVDFSTPGKYENQNSTEENIVVSYFAQVYTNVFSSADAVYDQLDPEYIKYKGFTKESFNKFLESKKLLGTRLTMSRYKKYKLNDSIMIYSVYFKNEETGLQDSVIIKETSPNNFKITFENFLSYKKDIGPFAKGGLQIDINELLIEESQIKLDINITNSEYSQIVINSNNEYNPIKLMSKDKYYKNISDSIRNETRNISKGTATNYLGHYLVEDNNYNLTSVYITNVLYENLDKNEPITFEIK